jgi:hypothetical protein
MGQEHFSGRQTYIIILLVDCSCRFKGGRCLMKENTDLQNDIAVLLLKILLQQGRINKATYKRALEKIRREQEEVA